MHYDTVIFDLDGTLLNTIDDLAGAVNHAMASLGFPQHSVPAVAAMVGNGLSRLIELALPEGEKHRLADGLALFKEYYGQHATDLTCAYDGILDMMQTLANAGVRQAIVSNKADAFVQQLNSRFFSRWVEVAVGEQQPAIRRKPWPDSVLHVMEQLGSVPRRTLYVGDSNVDVETARNAEVDCASVLWGFQTKQQLEDAGATCFIETPQQLTELILGE